MFGRFRLRFTLIHTLIVCSALLVVSALSMLRLWSTWGAYGTDRFEQIGWPWVFFERGGYTYGEYFYPHLLAADVALAVGLAYVAASATPQGLLALIRRARTWGTPHAADTSRSS